MTSYLTSLCGLKPERKLSATTGDGLPKVGAGDTAAKPVPADPSNDYAPGTSASRSGCRSSTLSSFNRASSGLVLLSS